MSEVNSCSANHKWNMFISVELVTFYYDHLQNKKINFTAQLLFMMLILQVDEVGIFMQLLNRRHVILFPLCSWRR